MGDEAAQRPSCADCLALEPVNAELALATIYADRLGDIVPG